MESITIRIDNQMAKEMAKLMRPGYATRSEFVRAALREKMKQIERDPFLKALKRFQGAAKMHVSDERLEEIREQVLKEYAKEKRWKLD